MASKIMDSKAVKSSKRRSRAVNNAVVPLEKRLMFSFYTAGDLVVYRVGTGAALSSAAAPISLDEYTTAAGQTGPVATVALPTAANGSTIPLEASGTGYPQGNITLSQDGSAIVVPGYDATTGTGSLTGTTSTVQREVDVVDSTGTVTSQTLLGTGSGVGTIYGAASVDGVSGVYASGSNGIVYASPDGATASTSNILTGSSDDAYSVEINNGQLYASFKSKTLLIGSVGAGLPTSNAGTTVLPGFTYSGTTGQGEGYESIEFAFATLNPAHTSPDTLYLADTYNDCVDKLSLVNNSWVLTGEIGGYGTGYTELDVQGILAEPTAAGEQLFISTPTTIYTVMDPYGYDSAGPSAAQGNTVFVPSPTLTTVATAAASESFYSLAFAPASTLSVVTNPSSTVTAVAGTSTTLYAAANPGIASTVQWQYLAPGGSWTNITNGTDAHGVVAAGATTNTLSLSNLAVAESGYQYQAVFTSASTSPAAGTATSTPETLNVIIAPAVISISPPGGLPAGGTTVTITGSNFANGDTVKFGSVAATSVNYVSPSKLMAVSPTEAAGTVDVTVSNGTVTSAIVPGDEFTFVNLPSVTGLYNLSGGISSSNTEKSGIDSGGDQVVITGANIAGATNVSFGGVASTNFYYNTSLGALVAVSPADTAGTVADVVVTNPAGVSSTSSADQFTYTLTTIAGTESPNLLANSSFTIDDNPTVTQILEIAGATVQDLNGNTETYSHTSFYIEDSTGSEDVFGGADSTGATSLPGGYIPTTGDTVSLTAIEAPYQGTPEIGSVSAISTTGTSTNYAPVVPVVTTIPHVDTAAPLASDIDGYIVTIKGVYISGLTEGGAPLTTFQLNNTSSGGIITDTNGNSMSLYYATTYNQAVITGPSDGNFTGSIIGNLDGTSVPSSGTLVDVTGWVDINNSSVTELNLISITSPSSINPIISSTNPTQGPPQGNNTVTISGYGLTGTTSVSFGGLPGTNVTVVNDKTVTVTAPAHALGTVNLTVTNENGASNAVSYIYTTAPTVSSVTPGGVSTTGTNASGGTPNIIIGGTGFTGATAVNFGTTVVSSSGFTVNSGGTQITVTAAPAHAAGSVDVTVTAPASGGGSVTSSPNAADKFIYDGAPTVSISPTSGPDIGGTAVTITGSNLLGTQAVYFGTVPATSFTYNATTGTITAIAPSGTLGAMENVTVTNYQGTSTSTAYYTYTATTVAAAQNAANGVTVTIDSNPVITAILSQPGTINNKTYTYYAFLINDGTGSEDIFYNPTQQGAAVDAFVPVVGNTISVTGVISDFRDIDEMGGSGNAVITSIYNTGTASVPAPIPETVSTVNVSSGSLVPQGTGWGTHLITLSNVTVTGQSLAGNGVVTGSNNQTLTVTDSTGSMVLYVYNSSYSTTNEQFTGASFPAGPETLTGFVYVYAGPPAEAEFVPLLDNSTIPHWLASSSQAIWNSAQKTLYVNGASTIISDPGSDEPAITALNTQSSTAVLNIVTATGGQIHIGGLDLTDGASVIMNTNTGKPGVLLVNSGGNFSIDATSTLNISNNFVDIPNGTLSQISTFVANGYNDGAWNGVGGITSSTAASDPTHLTAVAAILNENANSTVLYPTLDGATLASTDVLVRETYYGDANLDGKVDGSDYSLIDNGFENQLTGWYNGDFNYDGVIDGSDYTLIDNAFNTQGSHLVTPSALLAAAASPKPSVAASLALTSSTSTSTDTFFSQKKLSTSLISDVEDLITTM